MAEVTDSGDENKAHKTDQKPQPKVGNEPSETQDDKDQEEGSENDESEFEIDQILDAKRGMFSGVSHNFFSK
jgi:hypothetical protein